MADASEVEGPVAQSTKPAMGVVELDHYLIMEDTIIGEVKVGGGCDKEMPVYSIVSNSKEAAGTIPSRLSGEVRKVGARDSAGYSSIQGHRQGIRGTKSADSREQQSEACNEPLALAVVHKDMAKDTANYSSIQGLKLLLHAH